jgi:tetratricopeptide (TPR) repeat protein
MIGQKKRWCFWGLAGMVLGWVACQSHEPPPAATPGIDSLYQSQMLIRLTDSIQKYPDRAQLYFDRGGVLYVMKAYALAEKDVKKAIALDARQPTYYEALGEIRLSEDSLSEAVKAYRDALQLEPALVTARLKLAYVLFQQEQYRETINQTDTLLHQDARLAKAYGLRSQAYQALGDTVRALKYMQKAVELSPDDYDALMALGDMLRDDLNKDARTYYRRAARLDTTQAEPFYAIGQLWEALGNSDSAVASYRACIARDAYDLQAYMGLGKLYEKQQDWQEALKVFILASKVGPSDPDIFYHRGLCHEKLHQVEAALHDYENAIALPGSHKDAQAAVNRLRKALPHS